MRLRTLVVAIVCGIGISLVTGFFENIPDASIIGARYYGFPLYWRVSMVLISPKDNFIVTNLAVDTLFWFLVVLLVFIIIGKIAGEKPIHQV